MQVVGNLVLVSGQVKTIMRLSTFPFNVVAAKSLASTLVSPVCITANVVVHASGCASPH